MADERRQYNLAMQAWSRKKVASAIRMMEGYTARVEDDLSARVTLVTWRVEIEDVVGGLVDIDRLLEDGLPPRLRSSLEQTKAMFLEGQCQFAEASDALRSSMRGGSQTRQERVTRLLLLGVINIQRGLDREAVRCLRTALALDRGNYEVQYHRCVLCRASAAESNELVFESMRHLGDTDEVVLRELSLARHLQGRSAAAVETLKTVAPLSDPRSRGYLAFFLLGMARPREALQAIGANPDLRNPLEDWCEARAEHVLSRAQGPPSWTRLWESLRCSDPRANWYFIQFLWDVGERTDAERIGRHLLTLRPDHEYAEWLQSRGITGDPQPHP